MRTLFALSVTAYLRRRDRKSDDEKIFDRIISYSNTDTYYLKFFDCFTKNYRYLLTHKHNSIWSIKDFIYVVNLSDVPKRYRTYELCFKAVEVEIRNIRFVPVSLIDLNMVRVNNRLNDNFHGRLLRRPDLWQYIGKGTLIEYFDLIRETLGDWSLKMEHSDRIVKLLYDMDVSVDNDPFVDRDRARRSGHDWGMVDFLFSLASCDIDARLSNDVVMYQRLSSHRRRRCTGRYSTGYRYFDDKIESLLSLRSHRLTNPKIDELIARFDVHEPGIYSALELYLREYEDEVSEYDLASALEHQQIYRTIPDKYP